MKGQIKVWLCAVLVGGLSCLMQCCYAQEVVAECVRYAARTDTKLYVFSFFSNCGEYSRTFKPVISQLERRFGGEVRMFRVNIDNSSNEEFVEQVGVSVVPTVIVVDENGNRLATMVGLAEASRLDTLLESLLTRYRDPVAIDNRSQQMPASIAPLRALEPILDCS
ncbi:MAG: hypothetical protein HY711_01250 [Candidatus Melainabacteria bacterium]|nr:hypothetical protein [Candidatus Melainabacteria bacterium]